MGQRFNQHDGTGVMANVPGVGAMVSHGDGAPTESVSGYAKGGLYLDTLGGITYTNNGTSQSSTWVATGFNGSNLDNVYYVTQAGSDSNDGKTPASAKATVNDAVDGMLSGAAAAGGGLVVVGAGTFNVTSAITIDKEYCSIWGQGINATHIKGAGAIDVITLSDHDTAMRMGSVFGNFLLSGSDQATTLLWVGRVNAGVFMNMRITNASDSGTSLILSGSQNSVWQGVECSLSGTGLLIEHDTLNHEFNHLHAVSNVTQNIHITNNSGVASKAPRLIRFRGGLNENLDSGGVAGTYIQAGWDVTFDKSQSSCVESGQIAYLLDETTAIAGAIENIRFYGNQFRAGTGSGDGVCLKVTGTATVHIDGSFFRTGQYGIQADSDATVYLGTYFTDSSGFGSLFNGLSGATQSDVLARWNTDNPLPVASDSFHIQDGGTVTQLTSITTTVILNTNSGQITTVSQTVGAGAEATFTVTNSTVAATDNVICNVATNNGAGTFVANVTAVAAGSFDITISNLHASAAGDNTLVINFAVIGGSSS